MQPDSPFAALRSRLSNTWRLKARPEQLPPAGDWAVWLILSGRGWGKTRTGAEWVQEQAATGACRRMALVAPTAADVRDTMVEGASGILANLKIVSRVSLGLAQRPEFGAARMRVIDNVGPFRLPR